MNVVGRASSIRYEDARKQNLSSSVRYDETSRRDFVRLVRSCVIGDLVIVNPVRGINEVELCPSCMMSRERIACHRPSNTRNQAGGASSVQHEVTRKESLSSSICYEESSMRDFVRPIRSRVKGELVLVRSVRGIKQAGLRLSDTMSREKRACPRPSSTRNQARWTSSVRYEVTR